MTTETFYLDKEQTEATLTTYIAHESPDFTFGKRPCVIICPGGGYYIHAERESEPVVKEFFAKGFNCFILKYSLNGKAKFPRPVKDLSMAIVHVKENAEKYNIDPEKVFVLGFSAGGHVCGTLGTQWHKDIFKASDDMEYGKNKPCGMILCYALLSYMTPSDCDGCLSTVLGRPVTDEDRKEYSCEHYVDERTVPAYIWTTAGDTVVPPECSMKLALAMDKYKIPFELHIFKGGNHGLALANRETSRGYPCNLYNDVSTWTDEAISWADSFVEPINRK